MSGAGVKANFVKAILPAIKGHFDKVMRGEVTYTATGKPVDSKKGRAQ